MSRIEKVPGGGRYIDLDAIVSITEPRVVYVHDYRCYNITYEIVCRLLDAPIVITSCFNLEMVPERIVDEGATERKKEEWRRGVHVGWYDMTQWKANPVYDVKVAERFGLSGVHPIVEADGTCLKYEQAMGEFRTLLKMWKGE